MGVTESVLSWVSLSASYFAMAMAVLLAPAWLLLLWFLIKYLVVVNLLYY